MYVRVKLCFWDFENTIVVIVIIKLSLALALGMLVCMYVCVRGARRHVHFDENFYRNFTIMF